jgi:hypothetical protein
MTTGRRLAGLVAAATALRLAWAAAVGPGNDEAYHALFPLHPAWSYFDHPPMVAVVTALGMALGGGPAAAPLWALRLGFIALFAGSTWLMFRLTARRYGAEAGILAALVLNLSAYHGLAAGAFLLPDGPLLFFWLLAVDRLVVALERPERDGRWLAVGLAWGGALLSKYHAALLPAGFVLYLGVIPGGWRLLLRRGPWLALGVGLVLFAPVLAWNAARGWSSFAFQGGRAVGLRFRPEGLAAFVGGQAAYLTPWLWAFLVVAARRAFRGVVGGAQPAGRSVGSAWRGLRGMVGGAHPTGRRAGAFTSGPLPPRGGGPGRGGIRPAGRDDATAPPPVPAAAPPPSPTRGEGSEGMGGVWGGRAPLTPHPLAARATSPTRGEVGGAAGANLPTPSPLEGESRGAGYGATIDTASPPDADILFFALAAPPLLGFGLIACVRPVLPHWSLIGFVMLMPLLGRDWAAAFAGRPRRLARRVAVLASLLVGFAGLYAAHGRWGILQGRDGSLLGLVPAREDPTLEHFGWDQIATALRARGLADGPGTFLFTSSWYGSGQLAFGLRGAGAEAAPVLCYRAGGAHAFADWSRPGDWVGRDGVLVVPGASSTEPQVYDRWFRRIEPLEPVAIRRAGAVVRTVRLYRCVGQVRPFPFGREGAGGPAPVATRFGRGNPVR